MLYCNGIDTVSCQFCLNSARQIPGENRTPIFRADASAGLMQILSVCGLVSGMGVGWRLSRYHYSQSHVLENFQEKYKAVSIWKCDKTKGWITFSLTGLIENDPNIFPSGWQDTTK